MENNLFNEENVQLSDKDNLIVLTDDGQVITEETNAGDKGEGEHEEGKDLNNELEDFKSDGSPSEEEIANNDNRESSSSLSPITVIIKSLSEEGIIRDVEEDELKDVEDPKEFLRSLFNEAIQTKELSDLTEDQKKLLKAIRNGVDPNQFLLNQARQKSVLSIKEESLEDNADLQKRLISEELRLRNFSESDIAEHIKDYESLGKLKEKSSKALKVLQKYEVDAEKEIERKAKLSRKEQEERANKTLEEVKNYVNTQKEIIPGITLNDKVKENLYKSMTTAVGKDEKGNYINSVQSTRAKNPIEFETKLHYFHSLGMFDEKPNFDKIINDLKTKQAKGLDRMLNSDGSIFTKADASTKTTGADEKEFDAKSMFDEI